MDQINWTAKWITPRETLGPVCPEFCRNFTLKKPIAAAVLHVTAGGTYEATLNGCRISDYVLAPGWTTYRHRIQYQSYDVTNLLTEENDLRILVGHGWYASRRFSHWIPGRSWPSAALESLACIAQLELTYADGEQETIITDETWSYRESMVRFTDIWTPAILVVSINTGAYMAESVRGGIISIDPGQTEGAKAIGMTHVQTMMNVILPQALRNIMPQIGNNFIINVKDTSVMFIIGFPDFFAAHRAAVGASYLYFPSATVEMVSYLTMTLLASFLLRWVEKKLDGASSYELVQVDPLTMTAGTYSHPDRGTPFDEQSKEFRDNLKHSMKNRNFDKRGER
jgi:ABC-type amino acid transport system permease subunit